MVRVRSVPPWLTAEDLAAIRDAAGLGRRTVSLFAPGMAERAERAYERSAWVRRAVAARTCYPRHLELLLELRKPVAGVLVDGRIVMLDEDGVRLPGARTRPPRGLRFPLWRLEGLPGRPPAPGRVFPGPARHGASVAADLNRLSPATRRALAIRSIDVSNVGGLVDPTGPEVLLRTASGAVIEWGSARVSRFGSLDPPLARKFLHLARVLERYPGLRGLARVRVQFHELYVTEEAAPDHVPGG